MNTDRAAVDSAEHGIAVGVQAVTDSADRLTRAVHALHAALSQRPHWSTVQKNPDKYVQFAAAVERAANEVRDMGRTEAARHRQARHSRHNPDGIRRERRSL